MLHIILLILKIIGFVLLALLGILLLSVLLLLLIPVRYWGEIEKYDRINAVMKAGWLFRLIYFRADYKDDTVRYFVKFLGITIKTNYPRKKKQVTRKSGKPKERGKFEEADEEQKVLKESKEQKTIPGKAQTIPEKPREKEPEEQIPAKRVQERAPSPGQKIVRWLKEAVAEIKKRWKKITEFFKQLKRKLCDMLQSVQTIRRKLELLVLFLQEEENKLGIKKIYTSIKKILRHCIPGRIEGRIKFGTGDPCSTGQALGAVSLIYAYYGNRMQVIPDFQNEILEGEIRIKGRIRLGTLLIIAVKLLLNENFKKLQRNYKRLKEEL